MTQVRYLIDESLRISTVAAIRRLEPSVDIHRVGQEGMPEFGTLDPMVLEFCEETTRILVTLDRASMPDHIFDHLAADRHTAGVLLVTSRCTFRQLIDDLILIWSSTAAEEWRDTMLYLPLET